MAPFAGLGPQRRELTVLAHPGVQSIALPLLAALAVLGLARAARLRALAAALFPAAVLLCLLAAVGLAPWPPRGAMQKLPWLLAAAGVLAMLGASARIPRGFASGLACGFLTGALAWIAGGAALRAGAGAAALAASGLVAALLVVVRLHRPRASGCAEALMLLAAAAALAATAVLSASLLIAQACAALAVAAAVLAAWRIAVPGPMPPAALGAGGVVLALLAGVTLLLTQAPPAAMALLPLVFAADRVLPQRAGARPGALATGAAAMLLAGLVVAAAALLSAAGKGAADPYY